MRAGLAAAALFVVWFAVPQPARAIPIFAQRYHLRCAACHSVLPELNDFGNFFRDHGYRLAGVERHGTTPAAVRFQLEYERDPAAGARRFSPAGVILSNADAGAISAFLHYNLGAGGGPAATYLGYLSTYNDRTQSLYRAGLFELPLTQSPGQRLDDLAPYGYDGLRAGLNDLTLASPRLGIEVERRIGAVRLTSTVAFGEFKGAAYGGKPVATGVTSNAARPELGLFARVPVRSGLELNADALVGERGIAVGALPPFLDAYRRFGVGARLRVRRFELLGQEWYGLDHNADGAGNLVASSGGFLRLRYNLPHAYLGARYDAAAAPSATRDLILYAGTHVTPHARVIIEHRTTIPGGTSTFGGALTVGFPWPRGL